MIAIILFVGGYFIHKQKYDHIILLITCVIIIILHNDTKEHMTGDEAMKNLASMFNSNEIKTNIVKCDRIECNNIVSANGGKLGHWDIGNSQHKDTIEIKGRGAIYFHGDTHDFVIDNRGGKKPYVKCDNYENIVVKDQKFPENSVLTTKKYGIKSARGGYLSDQGGWKGRPNNAGHYEVMNFDPLPF